MQDAGADWLRPGTVLAGKYEIVRPIGRGGFGLVYEALELGQGSRVAVKVLGAAQSREANLLERFRRETRTLARLASPNVVRVLDSDVAPSGAPFLVMELLIGRDLEREAAERGHLPLAEAVGYVLQAAAGVAEAHANGVIHRDLKPSNLFLVDEPGGRRVKVLDFGLSKVSADFALTATHSTLGTPLYMPPEQIRSAKHVDPRSDVWSLAVILYRLVAGTPPFHAPTATDLLVAISGAKPKPLSLRVPGIPAELDRVLSKALRKRPVERFANAEQLAKALAPFGPAALGVARGSMRVGPPPPVSSPRASDAAPSSSRPSGTFLESSKDLPPESRSQRALSVGLLVMGAALLATLVLGLGARWLAPGLGQGEDGAAQQGSRQKHAPTTSSRRESEPGPTASAAPVSSPAIRVLPLGSAAPVVAPSALAPDGEASNQDPPAEKPKRRRSRRSDLGF